MENDENRGLINKKAYEDQLERFYSYLWLSFYYIYLSLILLDTQSILGALLESVVFFDIWIKEEKEEKESARGHQDQHLQQVLSVGR